MPFCPRSSVRSERHRAKVEVAGAIPAEDAILPLCLSSYRASFVNSYSSVRVRPGAPFHGDHDVTAAARPVTAPVPVRIRLVTPISIQKRRRGGASRVDAKAAAHAANFYPVGRAAQAAVCKTAEAGATPARDSNEHRC